MRLIFNLKLVANSVDVILCRLLYFPQRLHVGLGLGEGGFHGHHWAVLVMPVAVLRFPCKMAPVAVHPSRDLLRWSVERCSVLAHITTSARKSIPHTGQKFGM